VLVPDYAAPIIGWRAWHVVEEDGDLLLSSVVYPLLWRPGTVTHAECRPFPDAGSLHPAEHVAPQRDCFCGVYAGTTAQHAEPYLDGYGHLIGSAPVVLGRVALWGTVVECAEGWRGSHAYPHDLFVPTRGASRTPDELALGLARYGVPVEILDCQPRRGVVSRALGELAA
jgi:hypothetical protein